MDLATTNPLRRATRRSTGSSTDASAGGGTGHGAGGPGGDRLADWVALVDAAYPERDAESWDATGLQVGDPEDRVTRVLVCLDVTPETLAEAASTGCDLVLAHHPLLFRPLARLTPATAAGRLALAAARQGTAVLAAHTNLDAAVDGTTAPIVELLGLRDVRPLAPSEPPAQIKLVTFVPQETTAAVLDALAAAGGGAIGAYTECSFRVVGTGTFRPSASASPAVGERERRNEVVEDRLEILAPAGRAAALVAALRAAHPYEEVAVDLYPLLATPGGGKGIGRIGELAEPLALGELAERLAVGLPSPHLRVAGDLDARVQRVAACGGAGDSLLGAAAAAGADVYVTGDLRHHVALDARTQGLALIDAGHHATEAAALPRFVEVLATGARERGLRAVLLASEISTDPWVPRAAADEERDREGHSS